MRMGKIYVEEGNLGLGDWGTSNPLSFLRKPNVSLCGKIENIFVNTFGLVLWMSTKNNLFFLVDPPFPH